MNRRMKILVGVLAGLLTATTIWGYQYMARQRDLAGRARADLADCRSLGARLMQCRPILEAAPKAGQGGAENARIEEVARSAGIEPNCVVRIDHEPSRRIGDTAYKEEPTQVQLQKVSLPQVAALAHGLLSSDISLSASAVRLSAPRENDTGNLWNAELVLSYLIYDPARTEGSPRP